ncbi:hypothetical protein PFX98_07050 [Paucibacter sediminis]|uniref:Uncharacterized protein n=1 Tax=Paucibacter sediminis TaxID=3019553 RepID=A0AA95NNQ6_9BURK|nr:hypothetical protein [Paucibacter sp. S2-9]WIT13361.1 hypothetical protein PFX98_07050 [Paucibacter sp. S2-9]
MNRSETFAKRVFFWAAVYGIVMLAPQYFLEGQLGRDFPPPITHPEHFYGFIGLAIARQPTRLRPVMLAAVLEKFSFAASSFALLAAARAPLPLGIFAAIDVLLGTLFLLAYRRLADS